MSLKRRIRALESHPVLQKMGPKIDPLFEYTVTGEHFGTLCKNLNVFYKPLTGQGALLRLYFGERAFGQDTKEPLSDNISEWYRIVLEHILQYPHRLNFDLAKFGLEDRVLEIKSSIKIEYSPK